MQSSEQRTPNKKNHKMMGNQLILHGISFHEFKFEQAKQVSTLGIFSPRKLSIRFRSKRVIIPSNMEFEPTKEDLLLLREWLKKMPHVVQHYEDEFLSGIIRASKGSLQRAKMYLENANALGLRYPEFFGSYDPLHIPLQEHLSVWFTFPLPKKTKEGATIIFSCVNFKCNDPSKSRVNNYYRFLLLSFYVLLWENNFGSGQWIHVCDHKGSGLAHMKDMTPTNIRNIINILECSVPIRLHSITAFNVPTILERIYNFVKLFAKSKLAERIFVYSNIDKITEHVPLAILPKEYGGDEESVFVLHDNWKKKMESYRDRFLEEERKMRELDHLRLRSDNDDTTETFRQLAID